MTCKMSPRGVLTLSEQDFKFVLNLVSKIEMSSKGV